jgi:O-antigen/teichoic acid export membrane protein
VLVIGGGSALAQLISLAAMPLVTRLYTAAEIGVLNLFMSFFGFWSCALCLRYENALLIAKDDRESHQIRRLATIIVVLMSLFGVLIMSAMQRLNIAEFSQIPIWVLWFLLLLFLGHGFFVVNRAWALRGQLFTAITRASVFRSVANAGTKVVAGIAGGGGGGLLLGELAGAVVAMPKLMRAAKAHFKVTEPDRFPLAELQAVGVRYRKFPMLEAPSAWIDALAAALPVPFVTTLYGIEAAGWFGMARLLVSVLNAQVGAAVADVFQIELAQVCNRNDFCAGRELFGSLVKKLALWGMFPYTAIALASPSLFPLILGEPWREGGVIAACLAPWMYAAFIVSPLSRSLSVFQAQEWKAAYDLSAVILVIAAYVAAKRWNLGLVEFSFLLAIFNVFGYGLYGVLIFKMFSRKMTQMPKTPAME